MSSRMLRRALREKEASELVNEESEEEVDERAGGAAENIFGHLQGFVEDEGEEEEEEEQQVTAPSSSSEQRQPSSKSSRKTKKKKGGKGKKKANENAPLEEEDDDEEQVSQPMKKMSLKAPAKKEKEIPVQASRETILSADPKHLRAEEELRHIFGSKVVNSVNRSNQMAAQRRRNLLPHQYAKKTLIKPNPLWPKWTGGVSMELQEVTGDGIMLFKYVHSKEYTGIQRRYEACVETHDPHTIAALVNLHPFHIDSLLALSDVYRQMGEHQNAWVLLERCLYSLECAWHPMFNPLGGKCRLHFSVPENKPLFHALFRHMQQLGRRGCHRTALEVAKLLLSLDPEDPTGVKQAIDYYALRAGEYAWLEALVESFYQDKLLPNFSFSLAIACFHLEKGEAADPDAVPSSDLLQQALMIHPAAVRRIVARTPIKEDSVWKSVLGSPPFAGASAGGPTLEHLINIYVERNFLIWRYPELQAWLKAAAVEVAKKPESGGEAASWACARAEAFPTDHNDYQHLLVSDYSDTVSALPPDEPGNNPGNLQAAPVDVNNQADLRDRNFLSVFLESVFPWTNYGSTNQGDPEQDDEQHHIAGPE